MNQIRSTIDRSFESTIVVKPLPARRKVRALLIDIDGTLVGVRPGADPTLLASPQPMFKILTAAAQTFNGMSHEEATRRISKVQAEKQWWDLADFIVALELRASETWDHVYEIDRRSIGPTGPEVVSAMQRLHGEGVRLYITSNNPRTGIQHKLRLAGFSPDLQEELFSALIGPPDVQAMKWNVAFWKKALAQIDLPSENVAVVGDTLKDDYAIPQAAGIGRSYIIRRDGELPARVADSLWPIRDFNDLVEHVLSDLD